MNILEKYVRRGRRTASRIYGRRAIVLVMHRAKSNAHDETFDLTTTGTYIWKLLADKPKLKDLVSRFAQQKRVKRDTVEKQVVKFIKNLITKDMVEISDEPYEE